MGRRTPRSIRRLRVQLRLFARQRRRIARRTTALLALVGILSRRAVRAGIVLGVIAGASLAAGALAATFYGQFGFHPGRNADAWASRAPEFVGAGSCATCHAAQAAAWAAGPHQGVTCESCHGPLAGHPATSPSGSSRPAPSAAPTGPGQSSAPLPLLSLEERSSVGLPSGGTIGLCLPCHRSIAGRPAG
ncbi:MAG TPA: hypothetical protein VET90_00520, partial [Candidatus Binatus sp.]|nr:hypothetical protein [Candidatus Binatus sp.]